jgi:hypothetical protein
MSQDLITVPTADTPPITHTWEHAPHLSCRAIGETRMYFALIATAFASTVFVPSFIGIRARTNADWHSR